MSQGNKDTFGKIMSDLALYLGVALLLGYALLFVIPMVLAFIGVIVLIVIFIAPALQLDSLTSVGLIPTQKIRNISVSIALIVLYIALSKLNLDNLSEGSYQQVFVVIGIMAVFPVIFQFIKQHFTNPVFVSTPSPPPSSASHTPTGGGMGSGGGHTQQPIPPQTGTSHSNNNLFGSTPTQNTSQSPTISLECKTNGLSSKLEDELVAYSEARLSVHLNETPEQVTFDGLRFQWNDREEASVPNKIKTLYDEVLDHRKKLEALLKKSRELTSIMNQIEQDYGDDELKKNFNAISNYLSGKFINQIEKTNWDSADQVLTMLIGKLEKERIARKNNIGGATDPPDPDRESAKSVVIPYPDACTILNIATDASFQQAKSAFRKLSQTHHPDSGGEPETYKDISQAYSSVKRYHDKD